MQEQTEHKYTIAVPGHDDVHLTTEHHHSLFGTIEEFLHHHKDVIATAIGIASFSASAVAIYLNHGRGGPKIK